VYSIPVNRFETNSRKQIINARICKPVVSDWAALSSACWKWIWSHGQRTPYVVIPECVAVGLSRSVIGMLEMNVVSRAENAVLGVSSVSHRFGPQSDAEHRLYHTIYPYRNP
jgi:hypothetical protein